MTYETDGGGSKGLNWTRDDGTIVTFPFVDRKALRRVDDDARDQRRRTRSSGSRIFTISVPGHGRACPCEDEAGRDRPDQRPRKGRRNGRDTCGFRISRSRSQRRRSHRRPLTPTWKRTLRPTRKTFPAGSYIIDLDQPQRILIKAILEQDTPQDKAFVDDNMARFRRNQMRGKGQPKEDYGFYDITAWSLPLAFGVERYWTEETPNVAGNNGRCRHISTTPDAAACHGRARSRTSFPTRRIRRSRW